MNKNLASNLLSQGSIEQEYLSKNKKILISEVFDKNKKSSTKFQYWIGKTTKPVIHYLLFFIALYSPENGKQ